MSRNSIQVFFSYAHEDEKLKDKLVKHLSNLQRQGVISGWDDREIIPGEKWDQTINENLSSADIILLLVSADFMHSEYCSSVEVKRAMERHKAGEAYVIPIILSWVDWKDAPFSTLQALPENAEPVRSRKWANQDEAFLNIVQGIRKTVNKLLTQHIAMKGIQPAIKQSSQRSAEDWFNQAQDKYREGDTQGAIEDCGQAIKLNPEFAQAYFIRAGAYYQIGIYMEALANFNKTIEILPDSANAYHFRGNARLGLGDKQGAITDYQNAADLYRRQGRIQDYQNALSQIEKLQS